MTDNKLFPTLRANEPGRTTEGYGRGLAELVEGKEQITPDYTETPKVENQGQLNPDWVEWLMGWPVGWTDLKPLPKDTLTLWKQKMLDGTYWSTDPAELPKDNPNYLSRLTTDNTHRADRLKAIGNGQVPMCIYFAIPILDIAGNQIKEITECS